LWRRHPLRQAQDALRTRLRYTSCSGCGRHNRPLSPGDRQAAPSSDGRLDHGSAPRGGAMIFPAGSSLPPVGPASKNVGAHEPKSVVVVPVVRIVPVTPGGAHVVVLIVERPAPHHANASACACNPAAGPLLSPTLSNFLNRPPDRGTVCVTNRYLNLSLLPLLSSQESGVE
jgi:hypothetical protein